MSQTVPPSWRRSVPAGVDGILVAGEYRKVVLVILALALVGAIAAGFVLAGLALGSDAEKPKAYCEGTTRIYYKAAAVAAVPDSPECLR